MNQSSEFNDPKGQGMPPPYTAEPPPPPPVTNPSYPYPPPPMATAPVQGVVFQTSPAYVPVVVTAMMGPKPASVTCRSCNQQIVTRVETKPSTKTHLFALLLCFVFWPCVCLPYCIDSCQNADHYCPNCNAYIGSYTD
ncbi:hypothetical protein PYW07_015863 [Mythimna separata]|uniref:LITAF domain-containing protein n=1 Tax=Mythimna separata TaxID=271217 RepID=A0AAD7YRJ4_MYTSE|nr:hypothetical protein PYW07_015863 [Mythimna separata]